MEVKIRPKLFCAQSEHGFFIYNCLKKTIEESEPYSIVNGIAVKWLFEDVGISLSRSSILYLKDSNQNPLTIVQALKGYILTIFEISLKQHEKSNVDINQLVDLLSEDVLFEVHLFLFRYEFGILVDSCEYSSQPFKSITANNKYELRKDIEKKKNELTKAHFKSFKAMAGISLKPVKKDWCVHEEILLSFFNKYQNIGLLQIVSSEVDPEFNGWVRKNFSNIDIENLPQKKIIFFGSYAAVEYGNDMFTYINSMFFSDFCSAVHKSLFCSFKQRLNGPEAVAILLEDFLFVGDQLLFKLEFGSRVFIKNDLTVLGSVGSEKKKVLEKYLTKKKYGLDPNFIMDLILMGISFFILKVLKSTRINFFFSYK